MNRELDRLIVATNGAGANAHQISVFFYVQSRMPSKSYSLLPVHQQKLGPTFVSTTLGNVSGGIGGQVGSKAAKGIHNGTAVIP